MRGFYITLNLRDNHLTGMLAIDQCRRLKLDELSELRTGEYPVTAYEIQDEAFIRAWFEPHETCSKAAVELDWLTSDDVFEDEGRVKLRTDLSDDRAKMLYLRARFENLKEAYKGINDMLREDDDDDLVDDMDDEIENQTQDKIA